MVIASTNESDLLPGFSSGSFKTNKKSFDRTFNIHDIRQDNNTSEVKKPCTYCNELWFTGHRCEAFRQANAKKQRISRMTRHAGPVNHVDNEILFV